MKKLLTKESSPESERIFKNDFLEKFTRTSPVLTVCYYGSCLLLLLYLHVTKTIYSFGFSLLYYLLAFASWTFFEYLLHRYVFHFMDERRWSKRFHYMIHGVHHQHPQDKSRIFMPPLPGTIVLLIFFGLFYLGFGDKAFVITAGFLTGYGIYAAIHYMVHVYRPVKPFRYLWIHHAKHHYNDENKAFGVSSPFWDVVFRTMPD